MSDVDLKRRRPTINDVADRAGVAIGTVSRYLNGGEIRKSNRRQIEEAIEALGFTRNAAAASMKSAKTGIIGFLVPTFDEFHASLLNHLAPLFRSTGHTMLTYSHEEDPRLFEDAMAFFVSQRVDALIAAGIPKADELLAGCVESGIPAVIYNNDVRGLFLDRVFVDNAKVVTRAINHLIEVGHTKIAICSGREEESTGAERREGYEAALTANEIFLRQDYIVSGDWSVESGYSAAQTLMSLKDPPTAVFAANYQMTVGILEWMREHSMRTPQDLALVSFDDVDLFRLYDEGITAIAQPVSQIAQAIASYAVSRIENTDLPNIRSRTLQCDIILRGSSGRSVRNREG
ncbi:periplasmic binding protein/LacI transcriptional regulator [Bradyrhizobium lupini HPC(L)]|uniref:Periplasmic binding protein/LacI transcriptional regulator n=1 Tax=Bradyrhizobium lupini HPC(L) TaxID=1229491 RepID=A0ABP2RP44_RHILU|nr:periplasmic binding protein/LacI transcriptional regulator [Bradyrhizobium lupini HPC(L)]